MARAFGLSGDGARGTPSEPNFGTTNGRLHPGKTQLATTAVARTSVQHRAADEQFFETCMRVSVKRLAPREREIAEIVLRRGEATAREVVNALPVPISNSAVRSMLRRLEAKGVLRSEMSGNKLVYLPSSLVLDSRETVLRRVATDYFEGSLSSLALCISAMEDRTS
jgi:predicted transcriptional regulator